MHDIHNLDLTQIAGQAELLASIDDTDYLAASVVLMRSTSGALRLFCAAVDWPSSLPARLAAKETEIAELAALNERQAAESLMQAQRANAAEARIKELEAQLARAGDDTAKQNQEAMFRTQHEALADPIVCPDCGKDGWLNARSLQMHRQRVHQGMVAVRVPVAPLQFVEELGWRCAEPGCSGAFTRDMHDPAHCTKHATRITNGHEIAA